MTLKRPFGRGPTTLPKNWMILQVVTKVILGYQPLPFLEAGDVLQGRKMGGVFSGKVLGRVHSPCLIPPNMGIILGPV